MTLAEAELSLDSARRTRVAESALLFATLVWGSSFTWAKASGDAINQLTGSGAGGLIGPVMLMSGRFLLAGIVWMALVPQARRGWSSASVRRGVILGSLMASGLILQVLGLDRTTEAVSAFLTSLTILWVPTIMTVCLGKPPRAVFWVGVGLAGAGIWLMTGAMPTGFGAGEVLGLLCSVVFSVHIIAINTLVPRDDPWRMTGAQFVVAGLIAMTFCLLFPEGRQAWMPANAARIFSDPQVWQNLVLLVAFPTVISFGIMSVFQPRVDPTRATLIYLTEPIFAAGYAWMWVGRRLGPTEMLGAGLILTANVLVEVLAIRSRRRTVASAAE